MTIFKRYKYSIKARIFLATLLPMALLEVVLLTIFLTHLSKDFTTRYEDISATISAPFLSKVERKLATLDDQEDREGFLQVFAELTGTMEFEIWMERYPDLAGISFVDDQAKLLVHTAGVGGLIAATPRTGEALSSSRTEEHIAVLVPLAVEGHKMGALNFCHQDSQSQRELILVVDDEPMIRKLAKAALSAKGFEVELAQSGEEALDRYRQLVKAGRRPDLVLMDLGMPGMGGRKCMNELLTLDAAARVIIASGYSKGEQTDGILEEGAKDFINKPYELEYLTSRVASPLKA